MKTNYYQIFKDRLTEEEERKPIENESNLEKILNSSKKVSSVLVVLLTTQDKLNDDAKDELRQVVSDVKCIAYKPTTFRVVIPNGNYFDLKYDPTPMELEYSKDFKAKDSFTVLVSGKKFNIANNSELDTALDYINILLKTSPVSKAPEPNNNPGEEPKTGPEAPVEPGAEGEAPPDEEEKTEEK